MVRDGLYYGAALTTAGVLVGYLTQPWFGLPLLLLAAFCMYFFRDPEREIPGGPVAVSPADGKIVAVRPEGSARRVSIFLNIFDVHVNRTPIAGTITDVQYHKGRFLVASKEMASSENEQNTVTVEGNGTHVVFKQIAGLIARRIVCTKKPGDRVTAGERIGLIKFGSRVDVVFGSEWDILVREGMRVAGGSSVLARRNDVERPGEASARISSLETVGMPGLSLKQRFSDPRSPGRPRRAAYALPTLFTAGNIFLGFASVMQSLMGAMLAHDGTSGAERHFEIAAITIGLAVMLDGLDGRIARMTNTTSDFGREMDSLADVISFGIAPAVLAYAWGVLFIDPGLGTRLHDQIVALGSFVSFLFLLCGSARLARFNVQKNPVPTNPGRPNRKYFVGLPIPAAAAMVASVVYAADSEPITFWPLTVAWLALLALLSFLMVSTWRYYSFKDISLMRPRSSLTVILVGVLIALIWNYSQPVLVSCAACYVASGIVIRLGGILRRRHLRPTPPKHPEHQIG